jgi:hypothetical protein
LKFRVKLKQSTKIFIFKMCLKIIFLILLGLYFFPDESGKCKSILIIEACSFEAKTGIMVLSFAFALLFTKLIWIRLFVHDAFKFLFKQRNPNKSLKQDK